MEDGGSALGKALKSFAVHFASVPQCKTPEKRTQAPLQQQHGLGEWESLWTKLAVPGLVPNPDLEQSWFFGYLQGMTNHLPEPSGAGTVRAFTGGRALVACITASELVAQLTKDKHFVDNSDPTIFEVMSFLRNATQDDMDKLA